jgi:hypothetical protein
MCEALRQPLVPAKTNFRGENPGLKIETWATHSKWLHLNFSGAIWLVVPNLMTGENAVSLRQIRGGTVY